MLGLWPLQWSFFAWFITVPARIFEFVTVEDLLHQWKLPGELLFQFCTVQDLWKCPWSTVCLDFSVKKIGLNHQFHWGLDLGTPRSSSCPSLYWKVKGVWNHRFWPTVPRILGCREGWPGPAVLAEPSCPFMPFTGWVKKVTFIP